MARAQPFDTTKSLPRSKKPLDDVHRRRAHGGHWVWLRRTRAQAKVAARDEDVRRLGLHADGAVGGGGVGRVGPGCGLGCGLGCGRGRGRGRGRARRVHACASRRRCSATTASASALAASPPSRPPSWPWPRPSWRPRRPPSPPSAPRGGPRRPRPHRPRRPLLRGQLCHPRGLRHVRLRLRGLRRELALGRSPSGRASSAAPPGARGARPRATRAPVHARLLGLLGGLLRLLRLLQRDRLVPEPRRLGLLPRRLALGVRGRLPLRLRLLGRRLLLIALGRARLLRLARQPRRLALLLALGQLGRRRRRRRWRLAPPWPPWVRASAAGPPPSGSSPHPSGPARLQRP